MIVPSEVLQLGNALLKTKHHFRNINRSKKRHSALQYFHTTQFK